MTRAGFALVFFLAAHVGADPRPHRPLPDAPPPQLMVNIKALLDAARRFGVEADFAFAVAWEESRLKEWARSKREVIVDGKKVVKIIARGLMQISVEYQDYLVEKYLGWHPSHFNWRNPEHSAKLGCAMLRDYVDRYGKWGALACYNAGEGRYKQLWKGQRLPQDTIDYQRKVLG